VLEEGGKNRQCTQGKGDGGEGENTGVKNFTFGNKRRNKPGQAKRIGDEAFKEGKAGLWKGEKCPRGGGSWVLGFGKGNQAHKQHWGKLEGGHCELEKKK